MLMTQKMTDRHHERGFSLVEIALVLLVFGLFIGAVISFAEFEDDKRAYEETLYRQKKVAIALSDFASRYGYIPCPASPFLSVPFSAGGYSAPSQSFGSTEFTCSSEDERVGIIPFNDLQIPHEYAKDGFGNYMSFVVYEPASSNVLYYMNDSRQAHALCRLSDVWVPSVSMGAPKNVHPQKARFCCARDTFSTEKVVDLDNNPVWPYLQIDSFGTSSNTLWQSVHTRVTSASTSRPLTYFAYAIISHGKNGNYAPIAGLTMGGFGMSDLDRMPSGHVSNVSLYDDPGRSLSPSAITTRRFYRTAGVMNLVPGDKYYDNIVLWRTQEQVIAETGIANCRQP